MKVYYSFDTCRILTEEEAKQYIKEKILTNNYKVWEFITANYSYDTIIENLSPNFSEEVAKELEKSLKNPDYFLVREIPD